MGYFNPAGYALKRKSTLKFTSDNDYGKYS